MVTPAGAGGDDSPPPDECPECRGDDVKDDDKEFTDDKEELIEDNELAEKGG